MFGDYSVGIVDVVDVAADVDDTIRPHVPRIAVVVRDRRSSPVGTITNIVMVDIYSTRVVDRPSIE